MYCGNSHEFYAKDSALYGIFSDDANRAQGDPGDADEDSSDDVVMTTSCSEENLRPSLPLQPAFLDIFTSSRLGIIIIRLIFFSVYE